MSSSSQSAPSYKLTPAALRAKRISWVFLAIMVFGSVILDQVSKVHAQDKLMIWTDDSDLTHYQGRRFPIWASAESRAASENFYISVGFNYVRNLGAAWGALSGLDDSIRVPFFYAVTAAAVVIITIYLRSTPVHHRLSIFALGLVLSGAIGNFIDRIRLGYVIDWLDVRWNLFGWRYDFPNFNWADSAITVGVSFLLFDMMVLETLRQKRQAK